MRNYKRYKIIFILSFIVIVSLIIFILNLWVNSYQDYEKLNSIFIEDNRISFIADDNTFKNLRKNKYLYYNGKKKKIKIINITKNIYKKSNKKYHQILVEVPGITSEENLNISIYKNKKKIISLFFEAWKED